MTDVKNMMSYVIQKLNANESTSVNVTVPQNEVLSQSDPTSSMGTTAMFTSSSAVDNSQIAVSSSSALSATDEQFSDLPSHCKIPADDLMKMKRHSKSIGNFTAYLTIRLFPELFTSDNLWFRYNYNGVGHQKEALESQRRSYLQQIIFLPTSK